MSYRAFPGGHPTEREQRLAATIARIEEQFGRGSIQRLGATAATEIQVIPTGLGECDRITGVGGLPRGRIVEILGPESSGSSTLLLHALGSAQGYGDWRRSSMPT